MKQDSRSRTLFATIRNSTSFLTKIHRQSERQQGQFKSPKAWFILGTGLNGFCLRTGHSERLVCVGQPYFLLAIDPRAILSRWMLLLVKHEGNIRRKGQLLRRGLLSWHHQLMPRREVAHERQASGCRRCLLWWVRSRGPIDWDIPRRGTSEDGMGWFKNKENSERRMKSAGHFLRVYGWIITSDPSGLYISFLGQFVWTNS